MQSVETSKNAAVLEAGRVVKTFKRVPRAVRRFRLEVESLERLAGLEGVPAVLEVSEPELRLVMSRLPGEPLTTASQVPDKAFIDLRRLVTATLERGVSRHSIPPRDVIVGPDGQIGLVDFERVTLRGSPHSPIWRISCAVTRFHLLRLIGNHAPHLLSARESRRLGFQRRLGVFYHSLILFRRRMRSR